MGTGDWLAFETRGMVREFLLRNEYIADVSETGLISVGPRDFSFLGCSDYLLRSVNDNK